VAQKSKLSYVVHIFTKWSPIFTIFYQYKGSVTDDNDVYFVD